MKSLPIAEHQPKRPRYWLPATFTTLTLWLGLIAVLLASRHALSWAAYAILAALLADNVDGRIARLTGSTSVFGKEYDSLCDMVAFGVAPAFAAACSVQDVVGVASWLVGLGYATCAGLRLARFNAMPAQTDDPLSFTGLPSPVAASVVACGILFFTHHPQSGSAVYPGAILIVAMLLAGLLMISSVRFVSPKSMSTRGAVQLLAALLAFALISAFLGVFGWFLAAALFAYLLCSLCLLLRIPQD
ncbi:MAG: CDP-diacylglycerol--serine O-phosphatidyltransferase [Trinickia sp.]|uniref:CDP-diacylglycerol--serine O-phosphatidyltransferase n=1 Tax=Trinickia sp. TaxID=2571163 RepID=UPI003F7E76AF